MRRRTTSCSDTVGSIQRRCLSGSSRGLRITWKTKWSRPRAGFLVAFSRRLATPASMQKHGKCLTRPSVVTSLGFVGHPGAPKDIAVDREHVARSFYVLAQSFTKYLVRIVGIKAFAATFLPLMADVQRLELQLRQTTGRGLEELRTDWLAHLQSPQPSSRGAKPSKKTERSRRSLRSRSATARTWRDCDGGDCHAEVRHERALTGIARTARITPVRPGVASSTPTESWAQLRPPLRAMA